VGWKKVDNDMIDLKKDERRSKIEGLEEKKGRRGEKGDMIEREEIRKIVEKEGREG
jgi:hypothetical protein